MGRHRHRRGRAFCAGADLKDGAGSVGQWPGSFWEIPTINSYESGLELWKPTIAAVNGYCLGYGLTAVSRCDFVIAADDAEFGFPEVRLGVPTIVGAMRLPDRVGWSNAMELLLTGDRFDAARAHEMGLVWQVVPRADLMDEARRLADRLLQARAARGAGDEGDGGAGCTSRGPRRCASARRCDGSRRATEDAAEGMTAPPPRDAGTELAGPLTSYTALTRYSGSGSSTPRIIRTPSSSTSIPALSAATATGSVSRI